MNRLTPNELSSFLRRYRFPGGQIRTVRIRLRSERRIAIEFRLLVRESIQDLGTTPQLARLALRLDGIEEYRFQMRPRQPKVKIADARFSYLNGLFYVNFDAWSLEAGEQPRVHDYRASEVFAAGAELSWSIYKSGNA